MKRHIWLLGSLSALLAMGCSHGPPKPRHPLIPDGSTVAVIMFRDCVIQDQEDCDGSGNTAGSIFASKLNDSDFIHAVPLSRPVGPKEELNDDAAVALAKAKGYAYVLNGEVADYYRVAPMTFREERAAANIRVLSTADGKIVYFHDDNDTANDMSSPQSILEDIAEDVRDDLSDD
ncbi:MAG TPA: hypothetical protein VF651_06025 [Gammaproteobacteria bacterium]